MCYDVHQWVITIGSLSVLQESLDKYQHCDLVVDALEVSRYFQARNLVRAPVTRAKVWIFCTSGGASSIVRNGANRNHGLGSCYTRVSPTIDLQEASFLPGARASLGGLRLGASAQIH